MSLSICPLPHMCVLNATGHFITKVTCTATNGNGIESQFWHGLPHPQTKGRKKWDYYSPGKIPQVRLHLLTWMAVML